MAGIEKICNSISQIFKIEYASRNKEIANHGEEKLYKPEVKSYRTSPPYHYKLLVYTAKPL